MTALSLSDIRQDCEELLRAIEVIERRYPGCIVTITDKAASKSGPSINGHVDGEKSLRQLVAEATRKPVPIGTIASATGLTKPQIRGVLTAPSEREDYERIEQEDGSVHYKYIGEKF